MIPETAAWIALVIPLIGAIGIALTDHKPDVRETITLVSALLLFLVVASIVPAVLAGERPSVTLATLLPGLPILLEVEPLGMTFAIVASFLWIVNSIYSIGYMRGNQEHSQTRFYICFAIALGSTMGVAFAGNLLTLFIFYEVLTLSTYPLVTHKETPDAVAAGRTYLGILLSTSIGLQMLAIIWTYVATGTMDFRDGGILAGKVQGPGGRDPAVPLHVRHRQGGAHAGPPLAAGSHGGADTGERPSARGRRGQGRRVLGSEGHRLCLRARPIGCYTGCPMAVLRGGCDDLDRLGDRAAPRQPEAPPGLFHRQPTCPT